MKDEDKWGRTKYEYEKMKALPSPASTKIFMDDIMKQLLKDLDNDMQNDIFKTVTSSTPFSNINIMPSVEEDYPTTHYAWWKLNRYEPMPDDSLQNVKLNNPYVKSYLEKVRLLNGEVFMAKLEHARLNKVNAEQQGLSLGHTYDPWFRNITEHRGNHYQKISYNELGNDSEKEFQVTVGANYEQRLLFWGFVSTIKSVPIYLYLYTFAEFAYVNKRKMENHLKIIHPYNASDAENYDLKDTGDSSSQSFLQPSLTASYWKNNPALGYLHNSPVYAPIPISNTSTS